MTFPALCPPPAKLDAESEEAGRSQFLLDAWRGLGSPTPSLPCKYFYDARGSRLFDRICELPEYYVTRTEAAIMQRHADEMAACIGAGSLLAEYGSGSSLKTRLLLDALEHQNLRPAAYVPLDISRRHLESTAHKLRREYPSLQVLPVAADYTHPFELPRVDRAARTVAYFPGSTLGNFEPGEAAAFLRRIRDSVGASGALLIGLDLKKSPQVLVPAYNDAAGVTAQFNLNILARANRELGADFELDCWRHQASWNEDQSRIEMRLRCERAQRVLIGGREFAFEAGASILTEYSHKYTLQAASNMAEAAGFKVREVWCDASRYFSVQFWDAC